MIELIRSVIIMEEMLKQLLTEMREMRIDQQEMSNSQQKILSRIDKLEINMATKQDIINMEATMVEQFGCFHDSREVQFDVNERICNSLNRIEHSLGKMSLRVNHHGALLDRVK